jgi:hypothetical protein
MSQLAKLSSLILMTTCASMMLPPKVVAQTSIVLQAGVQLDDKVPSLDESLAPGNQFNQSSIEQKIQKSPEQNQWYKVPSWAAGSWKTLKAQVTSHKDEVTGRESIDGSEYTMKSAFSIGVEKDRTGQIWDFVDHNYWTRTEYDTNDGYAFVTDNAPGLILNNTFRTEFRCIAFLVDKATGNIISTKQRQAFSIYTCQSSQLIQEKEWHRVFDWHGNVISSAHNIGNCTRTDYFEVDPKRITADGRLLQPLFKKYLTDNRMSALLPQSAADINAEINSVMPYAPKRKSK